MTLVLFRNCRKNAPVLVVAGCQRHVRIVCIKGEDGLLQDPFVELYGNNAAAESWKGQERFNRCFLTGMTVAGVVLLGSLFSRK